MSEEETVTETEEETVAEFDAETKKNVIFSKQFSATSAVQIVFLNGELQNIVIASDAGTARVDPETLANIMGFYEDHKSVAEG